MPAKLVGAVLLLLLSLAADVYLYGVLAGVNRIGPATGIFFVACLAALVGIVARQNWIRQFVMFYAAFFMLGTVFWSMAAAMSGPPDADDSIWLLYVLILVDAVSAFYLPWCMGHKDVAPWFDDHR